MGGLRNDALAELWKVRHRYTKHTVDLWVEILSENKNLQKGLSVLSFFLIMLRA